MDHTAEQSLSTEYTYHIAEAFNFDSDPFHHINIEGRHNKVLFPHLCSSLQFSDQLANPTPWGK